MRYVMHSVCVARSECFVSDICYPVLHDRNLNYSLSSVDNDYVGADSSTLAFDG